MLPAGNQDEVELHSTSCKHSLVLLRLGEIITQNMLSWLKLLIKLSLLHLVCCLYYYINDVRSHKHQCTIISSGWKLNNQIQKIQDIRLCDNAYHLHAGFVSDDPCHTVPWTPAECQARWNMSCLTLPSVAKITYRQWQKSECVGSCNWMASTNIWAIAQPQTR